MTRDEVIKQLGDLECHCETMSRDNNGIWDNDVKSLRIAIASLEAWGKVLNDINDHAIEFEAFGITDDFVSVGIMKDIIFKNLCELEQETQ